MPSADAVWYPPLEPDKTEKRKDPLWNQGGAAFSSAALGSGFVLVWYDRPGQRANLFVRGQPWGESGTIRFLSAGAPLFTVNVDQPYRASGVHFGFVRVTWSSFAEEASGAWSALARVEPDAMAIA